MAGFSNPYIGAAADPRQGMSDQMNQQQKKKPWWTSLISEIGGAGGAAGGAALGATLGSVVPGLGTVLGGLAGSAVGGFLGGTGGRVAENEVRDKRVGIGDALKEGALDAVTSAGPGQLLRVAKGGASALAGGADAFTSSLAGKAPGDLLKTSTRGKIFDKGTQLLSQQYGTIGKPIARQTDALGTISKLADYGITKPQDAERIAQGFTGANGITNKAVTDAVGEAGKVDLSGLEGTVDKALSDNGVVGNHAASVKAFVMGQLGRATDSSAVDPNTALDIMRNIEKQNAEVLGKGGTYHLPTTNNVLQSKALHDINQTVGDALYTTAGADKNISKVLTPDFRNQLTRLNPGNNKWQQFVDGTVMKSKTVADLRSSMAPFVRISKIIDEGDTNALTFGGRMTNGGTGSLGGKALDIGAKVIKNPASRFAGSALRSGATAGLNPVAAPTLKNIVSKMAVSRIGSANPNSLLAAANPTASGTSTSQDPNALLGSGALGASTGDPNSLLGQLNGATGTTPGADATGSLLSTVGGANDATASLLGQPSPTSSKGGPSLASLQQAIQQDIASTGGKNISNLMQLGQLYGLVDSSGSPVNSNTSNSKTATPTATQAGLVSGGISALTQLAQLLQSDPSVIAKSKIPGQGLPLGIGSVVTAAAGTSNYNALSNSVIENLLHLQTGATATPEEVEVVRGQLPLATDDPATRQRKLATLYNSFQGFMGGTNNQTNGVQ